MAAELDIDMEGDGDESERPPPPRDVAIGDGRERPAAPRAEDSDVKDGDVESGAGKVVSYSHGRIRKV